MIWLYIGRQPAERSCLFRVWFQVGLMRVLMELQRRP